MSKPSILTGPEFFRKYSDIIAEAEATISKQDAATQINAVLMQMAKQSTNEQVAEDELVEVVKMGQVSARDGYNRRPDRTKTRNALAKDIHANRKANIGKIGADSGRGPNGKVGEYVGGVEKFESVELDEGKGAMSKILGIVAAAGIGLGAAGSASAEQFQSQEQGMTSDGQVVTRTCTNRVKHVTDLMNEHGQTLASHPEIIKQCGPYILTGQPIVVQAPSTVYSQPQQPGVVVQQDNSAAVAAILVGALGVAAVINHSNHHGGHHGGRGYNNYERQGGHNGGHHGGGHRSGGHR